MKSMIDQAFRRYGMTVTVEHGAETGETHGFVQPVTAVSGGEPFSVGPLGAADRRCWTFTRRGARGRAAVSRRRRP